MHPDIDPFANQNLVLDDNNKEIITPLAAAAGAGQKEVVEFLLGLSGCNPSARNHEALRQACVNGHPAIVEILLKTSKVDANTIAETIHTILLNFPYPDPGLHNNLDETLNLLLADGDEQINLTDFFIICSRGYYKTVRLLLSKMQMLPAETVDNKIFDEALNIACRFGNIEIVKLLLPHIKQISQETLDNIFHEFRSFRTQDNCIVILETLLTKFPLTAELLNGSNGMNGVFSHACYEGCTRIVKDLIGHSLLNTNDHISEIFSATTLHLHFEVAKLLLTSFKEHLDPSYCDSYSLSDACRGGDIEFFKILLSDKRINPAADDNYTLKLAVMFKRFEFVKLLLPDLETSSVNSAQTSQNTNVTLNNLDFANYCRNDERLDILKWLVKVHGVEHYSKDGGYGDAYREACGSGCIKIVEWLLSEPEKFVLTHDDLARGLKIACHSKQVNLVKFLLKQKEWQFKDIETGVLAVKKTMEKYLEYQRHPNYPGHDIEECLEILELLMHDSFIRETIGKNEARDEESACHLREAVSLYNNLQKYKLCFFSYSHYNSGQNSLLQKLPRETIQEVCHQFSMNMRDTTK